MAALVESGLCMAEAGHSRPASGAEHQYSHFWEMRLLREGRPPILHGLKVAIGSLESARLWDGIRGLSKAEAKGLLDSAPRPERAEEEARIRRAYGPDAAEVIAGQERFLSMGGKEREELNSRLLGAWETVLGLASSVPSFAETSSLLAAAGCPSDPRSLGLGEEEISLGLESAHYLRDRFTVKKLSLALANAAGRP
jgi:glycerol-1-phosphate dehydrogenase [NAD(P)+]